ncbi:pyridoxal-phosphate-dependent aminotransferase family protein [Pyrobaculum calidifontis]|uniref:Phosphoserine aminotransferase apoenzyme n=1 Tax=Pyrobaculum calidifontis (strain DSM 21063 / JCM 11548 / VA1) TaxID=410359 RepID=A3MWZ0_PYRCJ|nr:alanine--glyoxylate aminotransferase family protein [Pyrobaculum calidifontis]ABO09157.1 phosphoserine aminotransferase apoenzyme [Pyrobaculum calidifontis JCM 11548]
MKYLTPGPVQLPRFVIEAMAKQPPFHRGEEFKALFKSVLEKLGALYPATPVVMPGTGTLAVDTMIYNYVNPGDEVLAIIYGEFGKRAAESAKSRGATVLELERDTPPAPDEVDDVLRKNRSIKAVILVHNETSTAIAYKDMKKLADVVKSHGALLLVDAVSGFPAEPLAAGVDVVATASHKALLAPPGASILYLAKEPRATSSVPPSMDLRKFLKSLEHFETPYTPPIPVLYALDVSLSYILEQGVKYTEMHRERVDYLYSSVKLKAIPPPNLRSLTVTAFYCDKPKEAIAKLRSAGYVVAGGMYKYRDRSIRIGVMGDITLDDLKRVAEVVNDLA